MVLFDLLVTDDNKVIALANRGEIYTWDTNKILQQQLHNNIVDSLSVYKPNHQLQISDDHYFSISKLNENLVALLSAENIKLCNVNKLWQKMESKRSELEISSAILESKGVDYFNVCVPFNKSKLLLASAAGKILIYDTYKQITQSEITLEIPANTLTQDFNKFAISAIGLTNQSAIVGTKGGLLNELDIRTSKYTGAFCFNKQQFPSINKIVADDRSIYVGHNDYLTKWSHSRLYTGSYYIGFQCSALLKNNNEIVVGGNVSDIYRIAGSDIKKWQSSSRCTLALKQKDGLVYSCGTGNFIDIFNNTSRVCSLIAT